MGVTRTVSTRPLFTGGMTLPPGPLSILLVMTGRADIRNSCGREGGAQRGEILPLKPSQHYHEIAWLGVSRRGGA